MTPRDTIAAVATAPGAGGIGIVRLSGADAAGIARRLCGVDVQPRHAHYAKLRDAESDLIDRGLVLWFPGPHSFTGEDVVELQIHGAPVVLARLLARCIELGARPARAGEFSERAFLNGKIDLAQAEAIADLIAAQSEAQARAALRSLQGEFSARVQVLLKSLIDARLHVEAAIDFPEEEIDFLADGQILAKLDTIAGSLDTLLRDAERGQRLRDGLHAVIIGAPNAGKSSLLNALAGSDRAIVTDIAGTTRDLLREAVNIDGIEITLVDTAGLRESPDVIESEGIRRARSELARADLALLVLAP
ncbi:MAG: tRNA uridine-5-carboxymethylaminomethyl(34) synthesis GTPase MnmE, partial [Xanthomonadales bacterium]|nr:tRNA uridine-5-carboxymethylaminomethyl(34) synthesis GTPase MnmE [Xanthomonadales bacterium]